MRELTGPSSTLFSFLLAQFFLLARWTCADQNQTVIVVIRYIADRALSLTTGAPYTLFMLRDASPLSSNHSFVPRLLLYRIHSKMSPPPPTKSRILCVWGGGSGGEGGQGR